MDPLEGCCLTPDAFRCKKKPPGRWPLRSPVAIEAETVHSAAGAEGQRVARLVDDAGERICAGDSGQTVLGTVAPVDQVGQVALRKDIQNI